MADQAKLNQLNQKLNDSINDLQTAQNNNSPAAVLHAIHENINNLKKEIENHQMPPPPPPPPKQ